MGIEDRLENVEYINLDAPDTKTNASLCLYSHDIDIKLISNSVECEPTESHRRGDIVEYQKRDGTIKRRSPASTGLWCLRAPGNLTFTDKLTFLLGKTTASHNIWDDLVSSHIIQLRCSLFLHSWTDGFDIPASVMSEIGLRHWKFIFSMYSAEGDEILDAFLKPSLIKHNNESPDKYRKALAEYISVLQTSADITHQAEDRPKYSRHLACAARMFLAIENYSSLDKLLQLVDDERHSFGWDYLIGSAGDTAEAAFNTFATLVESAKK